MSEKVVECTQEHLDYLDALRSSGVTNMWGAPAYLVREFGLSSKDARDIFFCWMDTFEERHSKG